MIFRSCLYAAVLAMILMTPPALPAAGKNSGHYRSLAVMDLERDGVTRDQMEEIVDYLTAQIRVTQRIPKVLGRAQRDELLSRSAPIQRGRAYQEHQLDLAARLPVHLAVLGRYSWNGQQYRLYLRLLDVGSAEVLFEQGGTYSRKAELLAACDLLSEGIAEAAARRPQRKTAAKRAPPLEWALGFGLGQEGVSASSAVPGGSYLYLETLALVNDRIGIDARYALGLFPTAWTSHLLSTHLRLQIPLGKKEVLLAGGPGYLLSFGADGRLSHLLGARLVPIAGGEDEFLIELLPLGLYFDLDTGQAVFTLELLTIRFLFGKR